MSAGRARLQECINPTFGIPECSRSARIPAGWIWQFWQAGEAHGAWKSVVGRAKETGEGVAMHLAKNANYHDCFCSHFRCSVTLLSWRAKKSTMRVSFTLRAIKRERERRCRRRCKHEQAQSVKRQTWTLLVCTCHRCGILFAGISTGSLSLSLSLWVHARLSSTGSYSPPSPREKRADGKLHSPNHHHFINAWRQRLRHWTNMNINYHTRD